MGNATDNVALSPGKGPSECPLYRRLGGPQAGAQNLVTTEFGFTDRRETIDAQNMLICKFIIYEYEDIFVGIYCNDVGVWLNVVTVIAGHVLGSLGSGEERRRSRKKASSVALFYSAYLYCPCMVLC